MSPIHLPQPKPEEVAEGEKALVEALAVDKGVDLEGGKALVALNRISRKDRIDGHVSRVIIWGLYVVAAVVLSMFITISLNKLLPSKFRYLEADQVNEIYSFIVPLFVGFATSLGRKYLKGSVHEEN